MLGVPLTLFPMLVTVIVNARVSTKRLSTFLCAPEVASCEDTHNNLMVSSRDCRVHQISFYIWPNLLSGESLNKHSQCQFKINCSLFVCLMAHIYRTSRFSVSSSLGHLFELGTESCNRRLYMLNFFYYWLWGASARVTRYISPEATFLVETLWLSVMKRPPLTL